MTSPLDFIRMTFSQQVFRAQFARIPEPSQITDGDDQVTQYDQVMTTQLTIPYAAGLEAAHRARPTVGGGAAADLACGPGHYTLCLARHLGFDSVLGVDLSAPMVDVALKNAAEALLEQRVTFQVGDVTNLEQISDGSLDFTSFNDAAHHMPDLETVTSVLREMQRITKPDGLLMVMDLVRLRTAALTERYVKTLGHDYVERGLSSFYQDFRNSMFAAWTAAELRSAIPPDSRRIWWQFVPRGLPTIQILLGLPEGRSKPLLRSGWPWQEDHHPVPLPLRTDWKMMRMMLFNGAKKKIGGS